VSTIKDPFGRNSSGSGLENQEYGREDPLCCPRYTQKLALTSPTSGGRSVGIVRSQTKTTGLLVITDMLAQRWDHMQKDLSKGNRSTAVSNIQL
jgi:hypothetical protein